MRRKVCPVPGEPMSESDAAEIAKFKAWIGVEASRRAGGDPAVCNTLEQALYPEGIGRPPINPIDA